MPKPANMDDLDALIEIQRRLNHQVRQHFGSINSPPRELSDEEAQKARALICDLRFLISELVLQRDITGQAMSGVIRNVNVSLAYLNVGRSVERSRRLPNV